MRDDDDRLYDAMWDRRDWAAWEQPRRMADLCGTHDCNGPTLEGGWCDDCPFAASIAQWTIQQIEENKMVNEHVYDAPRVSVSFKKSSSDKGGYGFDITVDEGAVAADAQAIFDIALDLKRQADEALKPKDDTEEKLLRSLAVVRGKEISE